MESAGEKEFEQASEKLYNLLCLIKLDGGRSLNTIQVTEDNNNNKLLTGADLRNPSKIKDYNRLYGLDEFSEYIVSEAKREVKDREELSKNLTKIDTVFDNLTKKMVEIVQELKEKFRSTIVPSTLCSAFCQKLLAGELDNLDLLKTEMNSLCQRLHMYQQINLEEDIEKLEKLVETKIKRAQVLFDPMLDEFKRIRPLRGINFLPTGFNSNWKTKAFSSAPHNDYRGIAASPKGDTVFGMSKGQVAILDALTGEKLQELAFDVGSSTTHSGVTVNSSGSNFAVHSNNKALYICQADGTILHRITDMSSTIFSSCWVNDTQVAVGFSNGEVNVYSSIDGRKTVTLKPFTRGIYALAGLETDQIFIGTDNGNLALWTLDNKKIWGLDTYHSSQVGAMSVSWDRNKLASVGYDKRAKVLDINKKEVIMNFLMSGNGFGVAWAPGDYFLILLVSGAGLLAIDESGKTHVSQNISGSVKGLTAVWKLGTIVVSDDQGTYHSFALN